MITQQLQIDTPFGKQPLTAPAGWEFDKTAVVVWSRLLGLTRDRGKPLRLARDAFVIDGQIDVLSNVLANAIGMAGHYWMLAAREIVKAETEAK